MKKIILSTGNKNKVREIKEILKDLRLQVVSKDEVGLSDMDVEETEKTLSGNALKKARAIWEETKAAVMADDTGLFVDSLGGEPGVYSARYAGEHADDRDNRAKLLKNMEKAEDRSARFITSIALVFEDGSSEVIEGECVGRITEFEKGENGFGYDSIFMPDGYDKTFAELPSETKNIISHRAKALTKFKERLERL